MTDKQKGMNQIQRLGWGSLGRAPSGPGVYAWYLEPEITNFDLDTLIMDIGDRLRADDRAGAEAAVERLLSEKVMRPFRQDPYLVSMTGQLKPPHSGLAHHDQRVSKSLVSRIVEEPLRLRSLRDFLTASAPNFASPLYIGMSDHLRGRLSTHRSLIERFRECRAHGPLSPPSSAVEQTEEAGFARRVVDRGIAPTRLFVMVCETTELAGLHVDAENILNRLYFPILGRN